MAEMSATFSTPCATLVARPTNLHLRRHHPFSPPQNLSFPHQSKLSRKIPTITICHRKLDVSAGGATDDIGEMFFNNNELTEEYESDDDEDDDTESSIDLLYRFLQSLFKKISKRAKKASRSVLPDVISPQLTSLGQCGNCPHFGSVTVQVSFAVDGILLLAVLSVVKALLEVVCTLGSTVFAGILLVRVVWIAISFFQSNMDTFNRHGSSFSGAQPVT